MPHKFKITDLDPSVAKRLIHEIKKGHGKKTYEIPKKYGQVFREYVSPLSEKTRFL